MASSDNLNSVIIMLVKDEEDVIYHSLLHHNGVQELFHIE